MSHSSQYQGSFRDPSGFIFFRDGKLYRQINKTYQADYKHLLDSGLYQYLLDHQLLLKHQEVEVSPYDKSTAYKVIRPTELPFISYPYEWCFSQYKQAALITLDIQKHALAHEMTLKDASAFNIQFQNNSPVLIDTLSFEKLKDGRPWDGYQQFCKHFLAPLLLMAYRDGRLNSLMRVFIDGIPLDLASSLLPARTKINLSVLAHIHLHAKAQVRAASSGRDPATRAKLLEINVKKAGVLSLIENLEGMVQKLRFDSKDSTWGTYSIFHNYSESAYHQKKLYVEKFIQEANPETVWDLGANTGDFSRLASRLGIRTIAFDFDPLAVEAGYLRSLSDQEKNIDHFVVDLFNPSPSLGWGHAERESFLDRGPADLLMALALIHHLAVGNNLPLAMIRDFFSRLGKWLIIEFVPKSDSQVKLMLSSRRDIFKDYTQENFEDVFLENFSIIEKQKIEGTERTLYLMKINSG